MKLKILLLFTLISFSLVGQNKFILPPENAIPDYLLQEQSELRNKVKLTIPEKYKTPEFARYALLYSDQVARSTSATLSSGWVYTNWEEMDAFLAKIVENVIPSEYRKKENVRVFLTRSGYLNFSLRASGKFIFNVGWWPYLESEAALAAMIAYEYAHYHAHHGLDVFINEKIEKYEKEKNKFRLVRADGLTRELEADALALEWLMDSPYSLEGYKQFFGIINRLTKGYEKKNTENRILRPKFHTIEVERSTLLHQKIKERGDKGTLFLQSEQVFEKLKSQAVIESLEYTLRIYKYNHVIEMAFKYHLMEPDNKIYIYYLLESIRRLCYLYPNYKDKHFITYGHFKKISPDGKFKVIPVDHHLFEKFDMDIMQMSPKEIRKIKARFYWEDEAKFITYKQAFLFFIQLAETLNCEECILTKALIDEEFYKGAMEFYTVTYEETKNEKYLDTLKIVEQVRRETLEEYLQTERPMFADYAKALLENEIDTLIGGDTLVVFNTFSVEITQGQLEVPIHIQKGEGNRELKAILDDVVTDLPTKKLIYLPAHKKQFSSEALFLQELALLPLFDFLLEKKYYIPHIVDPQYYYFFKKHQVKAIEFLNFTYTEFRDHGKKFEEYVKLVESDYKIIYTPSRFTKQLSAYKSRVVLNNGEDSFPVYYYHSLANKMKSKKDSKGQLKEYFQKYTALRKFGSTNQNVFIIMR